MNVWFCLSFLVGWQAAMGAHLPKLRYYTVAVLGVVFCGGYTTLDTVIGVLLCTVVCALWTLAVR